MNINCIFIGHVDAGKSTLCGSILLKTNNIDNRTIEKYKKNAKEINRDSWYLAFIMDINEEERLKGKTINIGKAFFKTNKRRYTIIDAPGHRNYVPNMINGTSQADVAILVISARNGEFESGFDKDGQTREHVLLAKTVGISKLIVVINKMDDKTVMWDEKRYNAIITKLKPFICKYCGFRISKGTVCFLPISGLNGYNIIDKIPNNVCNWYNGPTLTEVLDSIELKKPKNNILRIPIMSKFNDRGVIVSGKIESGTVKVGDNIIISPIGIKTSVENIHIESLGKNVDIANYGEIVNLQLSKDINISQINKGDVISPIENICPISSKFIALVQILKQGNNLLITPGYSLILHVHTLAIECTIDKLYKYDVKNKKLLKKSLPFVKGNSFVGMAISTLINVQIEKYENNNKLGTILLRNNETTIGIGKIIMLKK